MFWRSRSHRYDVLKAIYLQATFTIRSIRESVGPACQFECHLVIVFKCPGQLLTPSVDSCWSQFLGQPLETPAHLRVGTSSNASGKALVVRAPVVPSSAELQGTGRECFRPYGYILEDCVESRNLRSRTCSAGRPLDNGNGRGRGLPCGLRKPRKRSNR